MNYIRFGLYILAAVLIALLAGFLWGHAGQSTVQAQLDDTRLRLDLAQGRAELLAARIDLFEVNFGRASQRLEAARPALRDAASRLAGAGRQDAAARVNDVITRLQQAQQQIGRLDQSANTKLGEAIALLDLAATGPGTPLKTGGPTN
jgi:hypothetical protein